MAQDWNKFFKGQRIVFWALCLAPAWVFLSLWFLASNSGELAIFPEQREYIPYALAGFILLGVLVSLWIRKRQLALLEESMTPESQQMVLNKALIFGCACMEFTIFTSLLVCHVLGLRELMVFALLASALMLLHYPSERRLQQLIGY